MSQRNPTARFHAIAVRDVEAELDGEKDVFFLASDPTPWYVRLSGEAVATLVSIGVERPAAEIAVFDLLRTAEDPDSALEGLVVIQRVAARTGDLPALAAEFGVEVPGG